MSVPSVSGIGKMPVNRVQEVDRKRNQLQELYDLSKKYKDDADGGTFCAAEIMDIVEKSNMILASEEKEKDTKIELPLIDGKVLNVSMAALKINASALGINTQIFDTDEFCEKLLPLISGDSLDCVLSFVDACFTAPVPVFHFLNGTKTKEITQKAARKQRRNFEQVEAEKKRPENVKVLDKEETEIQQVLEAMMKVLFVEYKRNGRKPISYITFVVDPHSFSNTVENMFHVSFLVKDGYVMFRLVDDLPVIEPVDPRNKPQELQDSEGRNQVIVEITMDDWEYLVEEFDIKEPMFRRNNN